MKNPAIEMALRIFTGNSTSRINGTNDDFREAQHVQPSGSWKPLRRRRHATLLKTLNVYGVVWLLIQHKLQVGMKPTAIRPSRTRNFNGGLINHATSIQYQFIELGTSPLRWMLVVVVVVDVLEIVEQSLCADVARL